MPSNSTLFVAMPIDELLELIEKRIINAIEKIQSKPPAHPTDELLSITKACELLLVSKVTIHKWKKRKLIRSYRIGRRVYFKKHELIESLHTS